ncbi:DUF2149 domain-containing protein [Thermomonas brevis]|jgi:hypothetical protein|uniref:DUF2149 domain-containing protein n=1 Tax=Thermomonas brevis TaxID=215691 RepID=A0A7G9QVC4_9GAMM|nr:DUF2149 domain-containing protein [Thermomonas brevis]QNN47299.1 DUF2149 domain-containing protein [Thermomonas brevis]
MRRRYLDEEEQDDPILSVVNLIDVFLVIVAILLIALIRNPFNPFSHDKVVMVANPGQANMEIVVKDGKKLERYKASGEIGEGEGMRAGTAYRLKDGSMIYVPEKAPAG